MPKLRRASATARPFLSCCASLQTACLSEPRYVLSGCQQHRNKKTLSRPRYAEPRKGGLCRLLLTICSGLGCCRPSGALPADAQDARALPADAYDARALPANSQPGVAGTTYYRLPSTFSPLRTTYTYYYLLPTTHYRLYYLLPPATYYLLPTTYYLLPTTHYLLPTTYYQLPTTYYLLTSRHCVGWRTHHACGAALCSGSFGLAGEGRGCRG